MHKRNLEFIKDNIPIISIVIDICVIESHWSEEDCPLHCGDLLSRVRPAPWSSAES